MKTYYNSESDLLEVISVGEESFADDVTKNLALFYSEKDERFLGFALHNVSKNIKDLVHVPVIFRLAGLLRLYRESEGLTQKELSEKSGISFRQIQNIEAGETNASIASISKIIDSFPSWDFSILMKPYKESA